MDSDIRIGMMKGKIKQRLIVLIILLFSSVPMAAHAEQDFYCNRLGNQALAECKSNNTPSPDNLKLCTAARDNMKKICVAQLAPVKAQIGFLMFMNSPRYSVLSDKLIDRLDSTELTEDALINFVGENNFNREIYEELFRLQCVKNKAQQDGVCALYEPGESDLLTPYRLSDSAYLIAAYSATNSGAYNPFYILYLVQNNKLYPLGEEAYGVAVDAKKKILSTTFKGRGAGDYGGVSFYKIDTGKHKLVPLKSFSTDYNNNVYISEEKAPDVEGGFSKRAEEYTKTMKLNLQ